MANAFISNGAKGVVKELTSYGTEDNNVYIVTVDGKDKAYEESNLKILRKKKLLLKKN